MDFTRRGFNLAGLTALGAIAIDPAGAAEAAVNRRIVLASRPVGEPTLANFRLEQGQVPEAGEGQVLLRTRFLSLDP